MKKIKHSLPSLNFSSKKLNLFALFLFLFIGIGYGQLAHIDYPQMPSDKESALHIDYGDATSSTFKVGIRIIGEPLANGQLGQRDALRVSNSSNSNQAGNATAQIAAIKSYGGDGDFIGVLGEGSATSLSNSNNLDSRAVGGFFRTGSTTNLTIGSGKFYIGGVLAELQGVVNNTPTTGAVAAVIARNLSSGTAQSWAAYLDGKNYLSDQTIIGRKDIPTSVTQGSFDVSNFNLFVTGGILTEECLIATQNLWADYVFEKDYDLKSLEEVDAYIKEHGYLPAFPSAETLGKTGIPMGQITILQQEKIEELFLHSIQLNEKNMELQTENSALKKRLVNIERRLAALEKN